MRRIVFSLILSLSVFAAAWSQQAVTLKQKNLAKWDIFSAHFSGITSLGEELYALVSDKEATDGYFIFRIVQDSVSGEVLFVEMGSFNGNYSPFLDRRGISMRDVEDVVYHRQRNTLFICGEGDQEIWEYSLEGPPTGRSLQVPELMSRDHIIPNYGFEALAYHPEVNLFWTMTESTLPHDGPAAGPAHPGVANLLRLQAFDEYMNPYASYAYRMDPGKTSRFGRLYAYGVPAITALPDGRLLVLEREVNISRHYLNSKAVCKLFLVDPTQGWQIDSRTDMQQLDRNKFLPKTLVARFVTRLNPVRYNLANYEGMCLGRKLADGRQTLLLINDSQGGVGKAGIHLKDYIKVLILPEDL